MEWGCKENEIIVGHNSGATRIYDTQENKFVKSLQSEEDKQSPIVGLGCTQDTIITGSLRGMINYWRKTLVETINMQLNEEATLNNLAFNKNRNAIGTGGEKNDFKLWDVETQTCIFKAKSVSNETSLSKQF